MSSPSKNMMFPSSYFPLGLIRGSAAVSRLTNAGSTGMRPYAIVFQRVPTVSGNRYATNLAPPNKFYTIYYGGGIQVSGESFLSSAFTGMSVY